MSSKNDVMFQNYSRDVTMMMSSTYNILLNFVEHQPACQFWCFHDIIDLGVR